MIYSFGYWCKPCREFMPGMMDALTSRPNVALYPLIVENLHSQEVSKNASYLRQYFQYTGPIYSADLDLGKKPDKR